ncbi:MAG: hydrogenase maturation nickel metallochaperone HypA [Lentisphaerae bacterium]|nr:hydrogenase maturation nickel metallochaperone HypA [Lentisphaerota bacterium]
MHELGIAETILQRVEAIRVENGAVGIAAVQLQIGDLSGVDVFSLELAFGVATENTRFADTRWEFERIAASVACRACGATTTPDGPFPICMACDSTDVEIVAGRELMIDTVEVASTAD